MRGPLGLRVNDRFDRDLVARKGLAAAAPGTVSGAVKPTDHLLTAKSELIASSSFVIDAVNRYVAAPWHLRACLLHGAVYGVPVATTPKVDRRPAPTVPRIALGEHDGDVLAALASVPSAPEAKRRDTERLLEAFTAQKINRIGTSDGTVEIEELEHARAFTSLPAGIAGTDRFLQRAEPGKAGGSRIDIRATSAPRPPPT